MAIYQQNNEHDYNVSTNMKYCILFTKTRCNTPQHPHCAE
ncbi:hypothetical protein HMPREF1585_00217 [Gardnerella vaginalis JCP8481B]|nr:hypothetical protein HMPREF1585_00217 [Gardnerella vaginalis JCP8481B]